MKKILFSLVALMCCMSINAQVMKVMKNGEVVKTYTAAEVSEVVFEEGVGPITGTAMRTGDIEVRWVRLWENGPKFAEYNVGATSETENGGYYCWGGKIDKNTEFDGIYSSEEFTNEHDTATNLWGSNWRMPTKEEFEALYENCDYKYISDYKGSGINVGQFTGKGDYAASSIVFPFAGYYMPEKNDFWTPNSQGWYWTSSSERYAVDEMCVNSGWLYMRTADDSGVQDGHSVRAVLAE